MIYFQKVLTDTNNPKAKMFHANQEVYIVIKTNMDLNCNIQITVFVNVGSFVHKLKSQKINFYFYFFGFKSLQRELNTTPERGGITVTPAASLPTSQIE